MQHAFCALNQRRLLDRRRLEDTHFQDAILRVAAWYNWRLSDLPLHGVANDTLLQISSTFYEAFMKKYSGEILSLLTKQLQIHAHLSCMCSLGIVYTCMLYANFPC